jgi:hypothetical protein
MNPNEISVVSPILNGDRNQGVRGMRMEREGHSTDVRA